MLCHLRIEQLSRIPDLWLLGVWLLHCSLIRLLLLGKLISFHLLINRLLAFDFQKFLLLSFVCVLRVVAQNGFDLIIGEDWRTVGVWNVLLSNYLNLFRAIIEKDGADSIEVGAALVSVIKYVWGLGFVIFINNCGNLLFLFALCFIVPVLSQTQFPTRVRTIFLFDSAPKVT